MSDHVSPVGLYLTIFSALMILTAVTVGAPPISISGRSTSGRDGDRRVQGVAGGVVLHAREVSESPDKLTVATGLFFLTILLGMSLIDYVSRDDFRAFSVTPRPINADSVIDKRLDAREYVLAVDLNGPRPTSASACISAWWLFSGTFSRAIACVAFANIRATRPRM